MSAKKNAILLQSWFLNPRRSRLLLTLELRIANLSIDNAKASGCRSGRDADFFHPDDVHMLRSVEMFALWWDGKVLDLCYQSNDIALMVLSADSVSVDDGFLTKLMKTTYSSCSYFTDEKTRLKGHGLIKSSYGVYAYHDMLVIQPCY